MIKKNPHKLRKVNSRRPGDKIVQIMDPIHNFIDISEYLVIQQLIDTPHFQRLRRLYQLGITSSVYPNATHSRFAHSIGVMHVFLILFDSVTKKSNLKKTRIELLRPVGAVAALLHDIGHGPFSHASEKFLEDGKFNHESLTQDIIRKPPIADILKNNNIMPELICDILRHQVSGDLSFVSQLISSQLDADRLDYLMRDALFTGVPYGNIDIHRIANTLSIWDKAEPERLKNMVVVSQKGIEAVESYLLGRYHMYRGVYYHKTVRCIENILKKIFERVLNLSKENNEMMDIIKRIGIMKKMTPETILTLDDHVCYSLIHEWCNFPDDILNDLCKRLINRKLLKISRITPNELLKLQENHMKDIKKIFKKKNLNYNHYFIESKVKKPGYDTYSATETDDERTTINHIMVNTKHGLEEISEISILIHAISKDKDGEGGDSICIFYPEEISAEIDNTLQKNSRDCMGSFAHHSGKNMGVHAK